MARSKEQTDAFLREARQRFQAAAEAEAAERAKMVEDKRFRAGEQWPADVHAGRKLDQRPCLTIDKLSQPIVGNAADRAVFMSSA